MGGDGEYRSVLPSGESGQVFDDHYDDQTELWLNGGYRTGRFRQGAGRGCRAPHAGARPVTPGLPPSLLRPSATPRASLRSPGRASRPKAASRRSAGTDGIWSKLKPEELASMNAFMKNPSMVWEWYAHRKKIMAASSPMRATARSPGWKSLLLASRSSRRISTTSTAAPGAGGSLSCTGTSSGITA